jgi:hypothetical protein
MAVRFVSRFIVAGSLIFLVFLLSGCSDSTLTIVASTPTATSAPAVTATVPPATATPAPGVCNAANFTAKIPGGPTTSSPLGPPVGFQYPPSTYYSFRGAATGNYFYFMCSSGNPASILAFMKNSIPAGGWTIKTTTATTVYAIQTSVPQEGLCASVNVTVGSQPAYPGEWDAVFHAPTASCTP